MKRSKAKDEAVTQQWLQVNKPAECNVLKMAALMHTVRRLLLGGTMDHTASSEGPKRQTPDGWTPAEVATKGLLLT